MIKLTFSSLTKLLELLSPSFICFIFLYVLQYSCVFSYQEFILEKVLSLRGPLLKDISMLDSVIKSKDVISMAKERCSEADVSWLSVLVSAVFACYHLLFAHLMQHGRREGVGMTWCWDHSLFTNVICNRFLPGIITGKLVEGAPFSKVPVVTGAEKLLLFAVFTFKNSTEIQHMKPSGIEKGRLVF